MDVDQPADSKLRQEAKSRFKYEEDLKKGGQYVDIVKGGGDNDYEAWQENTKKKFEIHLYEFQTFLFLLKT